MKVVITHLAAADLESIGDRIAARSPARAMTYIDELRRRFAPGLVPGVHVSQCASTSPRGITAPGHRVDSSSLDTTGCAPTSHPYCREYRRYERKSISGPQHRTYTRSNS